MLAVGGYFGRRLGSPPGLPGGGSTGVLPVSGVGARISGSTPEGSTTGSAAEPLGDKLARSGGVLCPPAGVDPEIRAPTPDAGNTPVIPPPGSPGGDPRLRPK